MNRKLNKSDVLLLAAFYSVSSGLAIYDYYKSDNALIEYLIDIPLDVLLSFGLVYIFTFWLIPKYIVTQKKYLYFVVFGLISLIIAGVTDYATGFWTGNNDWAKFPKGFRFLIITIDVGSDLVAFPLGILLTKKFYEGRTQLLTIEKQQKENELKLLRSQIDPHFLFNNLNTLDSLIDSDSEKAKEYINRLSLIYRYLIQTKDAEVMELEKEIQFAENYIFLIETRFGNDYEFTIEKNTSIQDKFIPTGSIQTLLENVVKHNKPKSNGSIKTSISIESEWLNIANQKSTTNFKSESLGTGLDNLKTRYQLLSDKKINIDDSEKEFRIAIPIISLSE
ncbi:histidine kinase [Pseudotenacibaculum sp. MALMAid0570]|uniref:sensor histidine kinase n=1 Tax=Pseudotenacibaculum sp. MALMAid0570 TaxID=3143938 RepID=UPI0032DE89AF